MTKTSIGVQELRTRIGEKAKAEPQHRFWGLYTHVWKLDVLREAYRLAKQNNGAPGVDGVTFEQVERDGVERLLESLSQELRERSYVPLPSRHVNIPKEGGKVRGLKIPAIRDRVVQGAVRLILEPIFEADFQPGSYGYRPGRSAHDALERVREGLVKRLHRVIDLDLKSYFDTVRHDLLLAKIARRVRDDDVLWLCKRILKASGMEGSNTLCGVDLAEWRDLRDLGQFRYSARLFPGTWLRVERRQGAQLCVTMPHVSPDGGPRDDASERYVRVRIEDGVAKGSLVAHLYDLGPRRGFRLVGLERPEP